MQKRIVWVLFIVAVAVLAMALIEKRYVSPPQQQLTTAQLVVPQSDAGSSSTVDDAAALSTFISLRTDETLLSVYSADFDGDGYEDQVAAVKNGADASIQLLVGIYRPQRETYERAATLATDVSQARGFSFSGMDVTGTGRLSLVYEGVLRNGRAVLRAYFVNTRDGSTSVEQIADLEGDGSIFVQQGDEGAACPIWVYGSDPENAASQLQTCYEWNAASRRFAQTRQQRVAQDSIEARELAKIQDGTVDTFARFLDGLWYRPEARSTQLRYLFFDYSGRQIIFLMGEDMEVYNWQAGSLHYRGMTIVATNLEIETLQRSVVITLLGMNELRVQVKDDVQMPISEESTWSGDYKKMKFSELYAQRSVQQDDAASIATVFREGSTWKASDGTIVYFADGSYTATGDAAQDSGVYTALQIAGTVLLQFRSTTPGGTAVFKGTYRPTYASSVDDDKTPDTDRIFLQPYTIHADGPYPAEERPIMLTRNKPAQRSGE